MKLALRLVAVALVGIVAIAVVDGVLRVRRENRIFHAELREDARLLGLALRPVIIDAWHKGGEQQVSQYIHDVNLEDSPVRIRWVWLNDKPGSPDAPALANVRELLTGRDYAVGLVPTYATNDPYAYSYFRVRLHGKPPGALEISESLARLHAQTRATAIRVAAFTALAVFVCALVVALAGVVIVGRPLHGIIAHTRKIGAGDFNAVLDFHPHGELGELVEGINEMSAELRRGQEALRRETEARIEALEQLRHADRLQTVGRLASGVAHELGTPLNVVSGRASLIASEKTVSPEIVEGAQIIRAQCERMTKTIRQLLDFARRRSPRRQSTDLRAIADQSIKMLAPLALKRRSKLELSGADAPLNASVDAGQIEQVLTNLVVNGLDAMDNGGTLTVETGRRPARPPADHVGDEGEYYYVSVRDEGAGIAPDDLPHIFEPFFTTKEVGSGTGLGLSIAYGIIQEHGGWIDVTSKRHEGSCFTVYLPAESDK